MEERRYCHTVQYYETDQMKVVHHSNYIRWFEEARTDYMNQVGVSYAEAERAGIIIPVVDISCKYKKMTRFGETVEIVTKITKFNGVIMECEYEVYGQENQEVKVTGTSSHCFLNKDYKVISLKRKYPDIYEKLLKA